WATTEQSITLLWEYFDAYAGAREEAREIRARRRHPNRDDLVALTELLRGDAVTVANPGALPPSSVTGPARLSERFSLQELVARM
ncbi:hypothetical protein G3M55_46900, partial [Streptomyces sp. SID8455]|nr:hypothetical protein [Streptomyces sp. SID8455]